MSRVAQLLMDLKVVLVLTIIRNSYLKIVFKDEAYRKKNLSCTKIYPFNLTNNLKYNKVISYFSYTFVPASYTKDFLLSGQLMAIFRKI